MSATVNPSTPFGLLPGFCPTTTPRPARLSTPPPARCRTGRSAAARSCVAHHRGRRFGFGRPADRVRGAAPGQHTMTGRSHLRLLHGDRPDCTALRDLFGTLTDRIRFLTAGRPARRDRRGLGPTDSATLGPVVPADGLTVAAMPQAKAATPGTPGQGISLHQVQCGSVRRMRGGTTVRRLPSPAKRRCAIVFPVSHLGAYPLRE